LSDGTTTVLFPGKKVWSTTNLGKGHTKDQFTDTNVTPTQHDEMLGLINVELSKLKRNHPYQVKDV
jgi:hypothetical protein